MMAWLGWAAFAVLLFLLWAVVGLILWIAANALRRAWDRLTIPYWQRRWQRELAILDTERRHPSGRARS